MKKKILFLMIISLRGIFFVTPGKKVNDTLPFARFGVGGTADLSDGSVDKIIGPIEISLMSSSFINVATMIVDTDVQATNEVVHVIDKVLLSAAR